LTGCYGDKWAVGCEEAPACVATEEAADVEEATVEEAEATTDAEEATAE
jgi:hypothetical protein